MKLDELSLFFEILQVNMYKSSTREFENCISKIFVPTQFLYVKPILFANLQLSDSEILFSFTL